MGNPSQSYEHIKCHMGSQVDMSHVNPSQTGQYSIYLSQGPEGWKAELTLVVGYIPRWFTCPQTVTHLGSNYLTKS